MPRQTLEEVVLPHLDAAFNYARWLTAVFLVFAERRYSSMAVHDCAEYLRERLQAILGPSATPLGEPS
jgi:hypothetical protein